MVEFTADANGRACVTATNSDGSSIVIYEQGAHLTSWKTKNGDELLYLSPNAIYANRVALRGGVPLIFPQFGSRGQLTPPHGFARLRPWRLLNVSDGAVTLTLHVGVGELDRHASAAVSASAQSHVVRLEYTVHFSNTNLKLNMKVTNASEDVQAHFHFAFHTYFAISDIATTRINGVNLSPFIDNCASDFATAHTRATTTSSCVNDGSCASASGDHGKRLALQRAVPTSIITGEFDRIYPNQACAILVQDVRKPYVVHVSSSNLRDVCVWNPGPAKAATLRDLPKDGYKHFVCVEHGSIVKRVALAPSSSWVGTQEITLLGSAAAPDSAAKL